METQQIYFAFAAFCKLSFLSLTMKTNKKAQGVAEIKTLSSSSLHLERIENASRVRDYLDALQSFLDCFSD